MKLRHAIPLLICISAASARASEEPGRGSGKPSVASRILKPWTMFRGSSNKERKQGTASWKDLALTTTLDPVLVKLSETRQIKVTLRLTNDGKRLQQLSFPTTQRIEVLVRNDAGKLVEQWSEDQSFTDEPTLVAINPGERLEYSVSISTRDMVAGQSYSIEAFFPNYDHLKAVKTIVPEK
jgi:hypothetical protein